MLLKSVVAALHNKEEFNGKRIDLTYITPQLIASAMPTSYYFQSFYRLSLPLMLEFLNSKHFKHWHIWNLQLDSELGYEPDSLVDDEGNALVTRVPTPDHNPLTMRDLVATVREIHAYLEKDPENVAVIHCKCGKGRTGSLIAAYLMVYHGMSSEQARNEFTQKRMRLPIFQAVSIPSQVRYLEYLERNHHLIDTSTLDQLEQTFKITHLIIRNTQFDEYDVCVKSLSPGGPNVSNWWVTVKGQNRVHKHAGSSDLVLPADLVLEFTGYNRLGGVKLPVSTVTYPFNIEFEDGGAVESSPYDPIGSGTLISQRTKPASLLAAQMEDSGMVYCAWNDTDGVGGLPAIRGNKAFDCIEIYWNRIQPPFQGPCFTEHVPTLDSIPEGKSEL